MQRAEPITAGVDQEPIMSAEDDTNRAAAPAAPRDEDAEEGVNAPAETAVPLSRKDRRVHFAEQHDGFQERAVRPRRGFAVPSTHDEFHHARQRWPEDSWQMKALHFVNSDPVQKALICMLVLDVLILFTELAIDAFYPSCTLVIRDAISCCPADGTEADAARSEHRFLASGEKVPIEGHDEICEYPLNPEPDYQAGCDYHKHHGAHVAHDVLFWCTIVILTTFELELLFVLYLLGPKKFFHHCVYIVDLFVVTVSLGLELAFHWAKNENLEVLPGILIIFRLWRFIRIGHGLVATTYEIEEHKTHLAKEHIAKLEGMVKEHGGEVPERPEKLKRKDSSDSEDSIIGVKSKLVTDALGDSEELSWRRNKMAGDN